VTKRRKIVVATAVALLFSFLFVIALGDRGAVDLSELRLRKARLDTSNLEIREKNRNLYRNIQRLKNDGEFIENVARNELGMVAKDEVVYQFTKKK